MKPAFIILAVILAGTPVKAATPTKSPFFGTWAVNVAKLPLPPGMRPKSVTMSFSDAGSGNWTTSVEIVGPDGSVSRSTSTYRPDGTPASIADNGEYDHVAISTPLPNVLIMALSKEGTPGTTRVFTILPGDTTDIETHVYQTEAGPLAMKSAEWDRVR